jgi:hypothetical protein
MPTRAKVSARMSVESILPAAAKASKFVSKGLAEIHFAMSKSSYLLDCLSAQFAVGGSCPNCGGTSSRIVDRKFLITQLRRCGTCQLLFRTPTDRPESNQAYYENEYVAGTFNSCSIDGGSRGTWPPIHGSVRHCAAPTATPRSSLRARSQSIDRFGAAPRCGGNDQMKE